jgi:hypothetical protein
MSFRLLLGVVVGLVVYAGPVLAACGSVSWTVRSTSTNWGAGYQGSAWIDGTLWLYDAATRDRVEGQPRRTPVVRDGAGFATRLGTAQWLTAFVRDEPDDPPSGRGARAVGAAFRPDTGLLLWVGETMVKYTSGPTGLWSAFGPHRVTSPVTTWGRPVAFGGRAAPSWSGSSGLAWDPTGRRWLYATSEGASTWLVESRDDGRSWQVVERDWWPWPGDQPPFLQLAITPAGRIFTAGTSKFAVGDRTIKLRVAERCGPNNWKPVTDDFTALQVVGDTNIKGLTLTADPQGRLLALRYNKSALGVPQ